MSKELPYKERFDTEIELECICYALEQAYSSEINIIYLHAITTDEQQFLQLKTLVTMIDNYCEEFGIDEVTLENIKWYSSEIVDKIRKATNLTECYSEEK
jgi:calcineurin-like phosphoesterase